MSLLILALHKDGGARDGLYEYIFKCSLYVSLLQYPIRLFEAD